MNTDVFFAFVIFNTGPHTDEKERKLLEEHKLIKDDKLTSKGQVYLDMLIATPLPVRQYGDPRSKK